MSGLEPVKKLSIRTERKVFLEDPALAAMGLLPVREISGGGAVARNSAMLSWRAAWILLAIAIIGLFGLFWPTAVQIVEIWTNSSTYNHGFLIPLIVAYLIWIKRGALANRLPMPSKWGVAVVFVAGFGWLLGELGSVGQVQHFALAIMVQGMFIAVLGTAISRVLIFPLGYLLFAVPFGEFMVEPLQDLTAVFVVKGLQILNIPVFLDGIFISIPTGNFEVAEACSGVRFLIAMIALGTLFAHLTYNSRGRKLLFVTLSLVVPVFANGFRAFGIVLLAYYTNNQLAVGVDHLVYGWLFFAFVTVIMLMIGMSFRDQVPDDEEADPEIQRSLISDVVSPRRLATTMVIAMLGGVVAPVYASVIANRDIDPISGPLQSPKVTGGWKLLPNVQPDYAPVFPAAQAKLLRSFVKDGKRVDLFVAYYTTQRQGREVISVKNLIADGKKWQRAASGRVLQRIDGPSIEIQRHRLLHRRSGRVAYQWYWVGNLSTGGRTIAKILQSVSLLFGVREAAASIVVSAPYEDVSREADKSLRDFMANMEQISKVLDRYSQRR
ncbi:MAG: exosortase A [Alphaproteobacteria bacterium]